MPTLSTFELKKNKSFRGLALPGNCNAQKCSANTSGGTQSVVWARVGKGEAIGHRETLHIVCLCTTTLPINSIRR